MDSDIQRDGTGVICDGESDGLDLSAHIMQDFGTETVLSAAGSSTDNSPCIVNSTKEYLDMRIASKRNLIHVK